MSSPQIFNEIKEFENKMLILKLPLCIKFIKDIQKKNIDLDYNLDLATIVAYCFIKIKLTFGHTIPKWNKNAWNLEYAFKMFVIDIWNIFIKIDLNSILNVFTTNDKFIIFCEEIINLYKDPNNTHDYLRNLVIYSKY
jgi:hypothetical protein